MKKILVILSALIVGISLFAESEQEITLEGVAVSNFKVISAKNQIIILYKNNKPAYICVSDIPFVVFQKVTCLPSDEFRAEVISARFHAPNDQKGSLQFASEKIRRTKTHRASERNKHGFITLQPKSKSDMDRIYAK